MESLLLEVGPNIWTYEGSTVSFYGLPYPTRMTIVRLAGDDLWVHSPEQRRPGVDEALAGLGQVKYLISPNKLHHLFLDQWIERYPTARTYSAPGLASKRPDIEFDAELSQISSNEWGADLEHLIFRGSPAMEEGVFFHHPSRTLILTDLIENFDKATLNWWQVLLARAAGILHPHGSTPIDWRLSFSFGDRAAARASLTQMLDWEPENILLSHGKCIFGGGSEFLRSSFAWLSR